MLYEVITQVEIVPEGAPADIAFDHQDALAERLADLGEGAPP